MHQASNKKATHIWWYIWLSNSLIRLNILIMIQYSTMNFTVWLYLLNHCWESDWISFKYISSDVLVSDSLKKSILQMNHSNLTNRIYFMSICHKKDRTITSVKESQGKNFWLLKIECEVSNRGFWGISLVIFQELQHSISIYRTYTSFGFMMWHARRALHLPPGPDDIDF